jgi:formylglycine-generating enzyme
MEPFSAHTGRLFIAMVTLAACDRRPLHPDSVDGGGRVADAGRADAASSGGATGGASGGGGAGVTGGAGATGGASATGASGGGGTTGVDAGGGTAGADAGRDRAADTGLRCGIGTWACGGACFDLEIDPHNCGECGVVCAAGETCQASVCTPCAPGQTRCPNGCFDLGFDANNCGNCGEACPPGVACAGGSCERASCFDLEDMCGPYAESCCVANGMDGGTFDRSNDPAFPATVSQFFLDGYEITVGRFRQFVAAELAGWRPPASSGKHRHLANGAGLNGGTEPGWNAAWTANLPTTPAAWSSSLLSCAGATWTDASGANEARPIDCLSWFDAQAFCIWDGGFLPTEAEWNWAAAGGDQQRVYPWSDPPPSTAIDCMQANYAGCRSPPGAINPDEGFVNAEGAYGGYALAGNVAEWVLDAYGSYPTPCDDCANVVGPGTVVRGGDFTSPPEALMTSVRGSSSADSVRVGARCARPF